MPRKRTTWELLFYFSLLIILFWLILKLTGVISSPALLEYGIPILSAIFGFFALYRDIMDKINRVGRGLTRLYAKVEHIEKDVDELKRRK